MDARGPDQLGAGELSQITVRFRRSPGPGNRERDAGRLDVHEQPFAIGAVAGAGELAPAVVLVEGADRRLTKIGVVLDKRKIVPSSVKPCTSSVPLPSSQSTSPPRGLTHMLSGALRMSAEGDSNSSRTRSSTGSYLENLPLASVAAARRQEVDAAVAGPSAFEARKPGGAFRKALAEDRRLAEREIRVRLVNDVPLDVEPLPGLVRAGVELRRPSHTEHLENPAIPECALRSWTEAIEPGRSPGVLSLVHPAGRRVDGQRLV